MTCKCCVERLKGVLVAMEVELSVGWRGARGAFRNCV